MPDAVRKQQDEAKPETLKYGQYQDKFGPKESKKRKATLERALDSRKFEIEMYWKRATYFWAFIAAAFAGYGVIVSKPEIPEGQFLSFFLACLGLVVSFGWLLANRGSKQWHENWENHVDLLEDDEIGPLFKVTMRRRRPQSFREWADVVLVGPSRYSVSKINQLISLYVTVIWFVLIYEAFPSANWEVWKWPTPFLIIGILTVLALLGLLFCCRTYRGNMEHLACLRKAALYEQEDCT